MLTKEQITAIIREETNLVERSPVHGYDLEYVFSLSTCLGLGYEVLGSTGAYYLADYDYFFESMVDVFRGPDNWETTEVIANLTNDEVCLKACRGHSGRRIRQFVVDYLNGPEVLYGSFKGSSFENVDWESVSDSI